MISGIKPWRNFWHTVILQPMWGSGRVIITCLLTYSMEQRPWQVTWFFDSQEIPHILWNLFKRACHLSLFWAGSIQSMHLQPTSWRFILILSSHLSLSLPSCLFPSDFFTKTQFKPLLFPHTCYMPFPSLSSSFDHPNNIWWVQILKLFVM